MGLNFAICRRKCSGFKKEVGLNFAILASILLAHSRVAVSVGRSGRVGGLLFRTHSQQRARASRGQSIFCRSRNSKQNSHFQSPKFLLRRNAVERGRDFPSAQKKTILRTKTRSNHFRDRRVHVQLRTPGRLSKSHSVMRTF